MFSPHVLECVRISSEAERNQPSWTIDRPGSENQKSPEENGLAFPSILDSSVSGQESHSGNSNASGISGVLDAAPNSDSTRCQLESRARRLSCSSCCWRLQPLLGVFAFSALKAKSELQQAADGAKHLQSVIADADQSKMEKRVGELSAHIDKAYPQTSSSIWSVATRLP